MLALALTGAGRARGGADRQAELRFGGEQSAGDGALAGARGGGDHQTHAAAVKHADYSTFCTCSRSCSIVAFSRSPVLVSAVEADLEQSVLASRTNSCTRKSNRRPIRHALRQ